MNRRNTPLRHAVRALAAAAVLVGAMLSAHAQTVNFTVINNCNQTIWPAIVPPVYQNGGWTQAANTTVTFPVPSTYSGRVWARKNCNTSVSPYQCDTGSCGGTGAQCAGSTGQGDTTLAEFTLAGSITGTDWYDVSNVDAYDWPVSITMSNGLGIIPTCTADVLAACPSALQVKNASGEPIYCSNACSVFNTAVVCQTNLTPQQSRDVVNQWPAAAQQYINAIHNDCGQTYSYPYDDWWGLHTVQGGSTSWTITFCPNGVQPNSGSTTQPWPTAPTNLAGTSPNTTASLSWTAQTGATSYKVYRTTTEGSSTALPSDAPIATVTTPSFSDSGLTVGTTYYYIVTAINASGFSAPSAQLTMMAGGGAGSTMASAPANLTATPNLGQITLNWTAVSGVSSYSIYRGTSATQESSTPIASGVTGTSYTNTGLTNGTTYFYYVSGVNGSGAGAPSNEVNATAGNTVYPPGDVTINCGGGVISPFVADTDFTGGSESTGSSSINISKVTNPAPSGVYQSNRYGNCSYTIGGFTAGASCTVRLHFCETYHTGAGQRTFNVLINNTQVLTSFDIFAAAGGQNIANIQQFTTTANSSGQVVIQFVSVIDNAQINGIEVYPANGGSLPGVPGGLTPTAGNAQVALTWNASSGASTYNVYRSTTSGGEGSTPIATGITATNYTNTGLTNGTQYFYKVAAVNSTGTSGQSSEVNATPTSGGPGAPSGLTPTAGNGQVALTWTAGSGATSYNVYRGTTSGGESTTAVANVTTTSYTNTGLTNGQIYYFTVKSVNSSGTSGASNEVNATPSAGGGGPTVSIDCGSTTTQGSFVADTDFSGGGTASWTSAIDTSALTGTIPPQAVLQTDREANFTYTIPGFTAGSSQTVTMYFVENYWSTAGSRTFNVSINGTQVLTNFDIYATAGAKYKAIQEVFNTTANSSGQVVIVFTSVKDQSSVCGITVGSGGGGTAPAAPTGLTPTAGNTQVALTWTGSSGATSYNVYRGTTAGGEGTTPVATGITATNYTNTGLTNGQIYYFTVKAVNTSGTSGASNEVNATPTSGVPAAPSGLTPTAGNAQVALTWNASSGATSYNVYRGTTAGGESTTAVANVTATSYTNTGLTNGQIYYFTVKAVNASGTSGASNEVNATPTAGGTTFISINSGGAASSPFIADTDFTGGGSDTWTNTVDTSLLTGTIPAQAVLQSDREGNFTYTIPGMVANSAHTVTLYFVEQYWSAAGKRIFSVTSNGTAEITNLDIYATAGAKFKAIEKTFSTTANSSGQIVLVFTASVDQAKCGGIVIN